MICQQCRKREAQYHSYRVINNELTAVHLCAYCLEHKADGEDTNGMEDKLHSILDVLLKTKTADSLKKEGRRCESCGMTLDEYEKSGLVGCPRCYELFSDSIFSRRKRDRSSKKRSAVSHGGDSNDYTNGNSKFLKRLESRLKKAVESENFEEAAHIRDRIKNLEKEGFFGDS